MKISQKIIVVGAYQVNCYLVYDTDTKEGVIIDPGDEGDRIMSEVETTGVTPKGILLTHGHFDHIAAVDELRQHYSIPLYAGQGETELLSDSAKNGSAMAGLSLTVEPAEFLLEDEVLVRVGAVEFRILATPGHSPGGVCYLQEAAGLLYCGDTLFAQSIGRTDLLGGSTEVLLKSINDKIMKLPDQVVCYPGHGPKTTVGTERTSNPFLNGSHFA